MHALRFTTYRVGVSLLKFRPTRLVGGGLLKLAGSSTLEYESAANELFEYESFVRSNARAIRKGDSPSFEELHVRKDAVHPKTGEPIPPLSRQLESTSEEWKELAYKMLNSTRFIDNHNRVARIAEIGRTNPWIPNEVVDEWENEANSRYTPGMD